jgi:hypothetical protein
LFSRPKIYILSRRRKIHDGSEKESREEKKEALNWGGAKSPYIKGK